MDRLKMFWSALSKMVILAFLVLIFMGITFLVGCLTELSAIVLGTFAIVFAIISLRE